MPDRPELTALPSDTDPVLADAAHAAYTAFGHAQAGLTREQLAEEVALGADGTPTMRIDELVEAPVLDALARHGCNVLSEEVGLVDRGSARTVVIDPLDGSANAAAGVPLAAFAAVLAVDGEFTEALTVWLDTGRIWWARTDGPSAYVADGVRRPLASTRRRTISGGALSLLRPHTDDPAASTAWWSAASAAHRVRILSTSCLEIALVASGATDAFADAASDTHRLMDIAAGVVLAEAAGGALVDVFGRAVELDTDLSRRWSGICGATPELAQELAGLISAAARSTVPR